MTTITYLMISKDDEKEFLEAAKKEEMNVKFIQFYGNHAEYSVEYKEDYHLFYLGMRFSLRNAERLIKS